MPPLDLIKGVISPGLTVDEIDVVRQGAGIDMPAELDLTPDGFFEVEDRSAPGPEGAPEISLLICRPAVGGAIRRRRTAAPTAARPLRTRRGLLLPRPMAHHGRVKELAGRLTALDPDAGAAVRVIACFDRLSESRAGLEALVRGPPCWPGCLRGWSMPSGGCRSGSRPTGRAGIPRRRLSPAGLAPRCARWDHRALAGAGRGGVVDAVILERAAGAVRLVLDRTRGRAPADDPALVDTVLDAAAPEAARLHAARGLGLDPAGSARAPAPDRGRADSGLPAARVGVGPAVPVLDLPRSWADARTALRLTAEGTAQDPGPEVVYADEPGGVALPAGLVAPGAEPPPDVQVLEAAGAGTPWLLPTWHAVVSTASLRAAAAEINVHHSTLQDRLCHAEHLLGWPLRTPQGRLRLQLALTMRHLARP